jgi:hypothetical protein
MLECFERRSGHKNRLVRRILIYLQPVSKDQVKNPYRLQIIYEQREGGGGLQSEDT